MRRLFQECKIGRGNAAALSDGLLHTKPEDLEKMDVIKVWSLTQRKPKSSSVLLVRNSMLDVERHKGSSMLKYHGQPPLLNVRELTRSWTMQRGAPQLILGTAAKIDLLPLLS